MTAEKKEIRTSKGLREFTYLGCPLTHNRAAWCFRLCAPDAEGNGACGRLAPHGMKSRIQLGIERHKQEQLEGHFEKLEHMYLAAPCNRHCEPGIRVSERQAEIVIPVQEQSCHSGGCVDSAVYFKAMDDSALFAVNSIVDDVLVQTKSFNIYLAQPIATGELIARGRLIGTSQDQYLAESAVTDSEGNEIGRGNGVYVKSSIPLSSDIGYR